MMLSLQLGSSKITKLKNRNSRCAAFIFLLLFLSCNSAKNTPAKDLILANNSTQIDLSGKKATKIGNNVQCIFQDKSGNLWFGTADEGVFMYDYHSIVQITQKEGLCSNLVSAIQEDSEGNIWFSNSNVVCRFNGRFFINYTDSLKIEKDTTKQLGKNALLFMQDQGIFSYNGKSFSRFSITPEGYQENAANLARPFDVYLIIRDTKNNYWFATDQKGVGKFDGQAMNYLHGKGLDKGAVRAVFEDSKGNLWFGNNGYGLFRYDAHNLSNITMENDLLNHDFLNKKATTNINKMARVWAINEDKFGNIWIGTIDAGVWTFDGRNLNHFTTKDGLPNNSITTIFKDKKDEMWFVAEGKGVYKFDGKGFVPFHL